VALHIQISTNNYPNDPLLIGFTILKSCISGTWNIEHTICIRERTSTANSIRADPGYLCLNKLKLCQIKLIIPHVPNVTLTQMTSLKEKKEPTFAFVSVCVSNVCNIELFVPELLVSESPLYIFLRLLQDTELCDWMSYIRNFLRINHSNKHFVISHTHIRHPQYQIPTNVTVSNEEEGHFAGRDYSTNYGLPISPPNDKCTTRRQSFLMKIMMNIEVL